ncbi:MAG: hypothetical protein ACI9J3_000466 [Parvicellaceae bacterium]|jgi:hypothetical protein
MKIIFLLFICLISLSSISQELEATWTQFTDAEKTDKVELIGVTSEKIVVGVRKQGKIQEAQIIEYGREFGSYKVLDASFENESIIYFELIKGRTIVFSTKKQEGNKKGLFSRSIEDGKFSPPALLCVSNHASSSFDFTLSPDGKHFGVIANAPYMKGKNEEIESWIFTSSLVLRIEHKLALTNDNRKVKVNVPVMSNTGVLFIIKRYRVGLDNNYFVFTIDPASEQHHKKTLSLMGKRIADVKYELDKENNLHLAGFYVSSSYNIYEGSFYFKLDQTAVATTFKQNAFTEEFLIKAEGKKTAKKVGGLVDFKIREMKIVNNTIFLTAEHTKQEKVTVGSEFKTLYMKDRLALVCLKPDGMVDHIDVLGLNQASNNDRGFWNQHKLIEYDRQLLVAHNLKDDEKVIFNLSSLKEDKTFESKDFTSVYSQLEEPMGINLKNVKFFNKEIVVTAWDINKSKFTVGIISEKAE